MHQTKNDTQHVRASFNCKKDVLDEFRRAVAQKYGRLLGVLCKEFERALLERLTEIKQEIETSESQSFLKKSRDF